MGTVTRCRACQTEHPVEIREVTILGSTLRFKVCEKADRMVAIPAEKRGRGAPDTRMSPGEQRAEAEAEIHSAEVGRR